MWSTKIPTYEKSFTETQAMDFIKNLMVLLHKYEASSNYENIRQLFEKLSRSYFDLKDHRMVISTELLKHNYVSLASIYLSRLSKLRYFMNNDVWLSTFYLMNSLCNYSNCNKDISNLILKTDLPTILISNLICEPTDYQSDNVNDLITLSIEIIYTIVRWPGNETLFNIEELKKVFVDLIRKNDSNKIGITSMLTLSYLVNEDELYLLEEGENSIKVLITNVRKCLERNCKKFEGFSIWELLNGLRSMSANDNMKKAIVKEDGIELIFDIIKTKKSEENIEKCLCILLNLCFDKDILSLIVKNFDLRNIIKPFHNHKSSKIRQCYEGIMWLVDDKRQYKQEIEEARLSKVVSESDEFQYDVFLSYSWANKDIVLAIRDELIKSNYKIWIDVDQKKSYSLEASAKGIDNSKIFIMAISNSYQTTINCRSEAEYAYSLKKPIIILRVELKYKPTSWLGIIMGSNPYYEFSDKRFFSGSMEGLLNDIKNKESIIVPVENSEQMVIFHQDPILEKVIQSTNQIAELKISEWSNNDVKDWLKKTDQESLETKFANVNGKLLTSMIKMNLKAPDFFYQNLKSEYDIKLFEIMKLNLALDELNI